MANTERVTGPHSGRFGAISVLLLTVFTWAFIWFLHTKLWHDPMSPMSPNEKSGVSQPVAPHE